MGDAVRVAAAAGHRALVDVPPHRRLRGRRRRRRRSALSHCLLGSDELSGGWLRVSPAAARTVVEPSGRAGGVLLV